MAAVTDVLARAEAVSTAQREILEYVQNTLEDKIEVVAAKVVLGMASHAAPPPPELLAQLGPPLTPRSSPAPGVPFGTPPCKQRWELLPEARCLQPRPRCCGCGEHESGTGPVPAAPDFYQKPRDLVHANEFGRIPAFPGLAQTPFDCADATAEAAEYASSLANLAARPGMEAFSTELMVQALKVSGGLVNKAKYLLLSRKELM